MDHHHIDQFSLIDRYLMGRLAAHESAEFEEHFIDCPQCIDRLDTTKDFIEGLRLVASDQALETESYTPRGGARYFRRMISRKSWPLAAGFFLFIVAGTVFMVSHARRLQFEIDRAQSEIDRAEAKTETVSAEWEANYKLAENNYQEAKQELAGRVSQLKADLQNAKERIAESRKWMQPQANVATFVLKSLRSSGPQSPINEIPLPHSPTGFTIQVPLEGEVNYTDYRVTILDDHGGRVWRQPGFKPNEHDALSLGLNSSFFKVGNYTLTVEGRDKKEGFKPIGNYPFRVIKE